MLLARRLAGLSALEGHYADVNAPTQSGALQPFLVRAVTLGALLGPILTRRLTERPAQPPGSNP
jgi:hypothetical protein